MKMITLEKLRDAPARHAPRRHGRRRTSPPAPAARSRAWSRSSSRATPCSSSCRPSSSPACSSRPARRPPLAVCGFGLAAAGAGAAHAIAEHRAPPRDGVVLVGAAGTYDADRAPDRLGARSPDRCAATASAPVGRRHRSAAELGLCRRRLRSTSAPGRRSCRSAAAAGSPAEAAARRARHPGAAGEEMEGYAVALAARLFGVA